LESQTGEGKTLRQYLLGELSPESRQSLEKRLMTEDELYEELLMSEDELIDQYLDGSLSAPDREKFGSLFLITPERREKLSFAASLKKYIDASESATEPAASVVDAAAPPPPRGRAFPYFPASRRPSLNWALAALLLLTVSTLIWVAVQRRHDPAGAPNVFAVTLTTGVERGAGDVKEVKIPADAGVLRLELAVPPDEYQSYSAALFDVEDGSVVLSAEGLRAQVKGTARYVFFDVPAASLKRGDYRVRLSGLPASGSPENLAGYTFRFAR
jgi:anti-sigma factor RsiW